MLARTLKKEILTVDHLGLLTFGHQLSEISGKKTETILWVVAGEHRGCGKGPVSNHGLVNGHIFLPIYLFKSSSFVFSDEVVAEELFSELTSDGMLIVEAPVNLPEPEEEKRALPEPKKGYRHLQMTGLHDPDDRSEVQCFC